MSWPRKTTRATGRRKTRKVLPGPCAPRWMKSCNASSTLQNMWMLEVRQSGQPFDSGVFPDAKMQSDIEKWERDYPGLHFTESGPAAWRSSGRWTTDRTAGFSRRAPATEVVLRFDAGTNKVVGSFARRWHPNEMEAWRGAFLNTKPSNDAQQAVSDLLQPPEQMMGHSNFLPTETGISFEEIACYRLLTATQCATDHVAAAIGLVACD